MRNVTKEVSTHASLGSIHSVTMRKKRMDLVSADIAAVVEDDKRKRLLQQQQ